MSRQKETFEPLEAGKVGLYTCGPTVYNVAHIGNFRAYMFEDLLRRHLVFRGYDVQHIMNVTDVEDKIIRTCQENGEPRQALTDRFTKVFLEDIDSLNILRAHAYPAATDHIDEMVDFIKGLMEKDLAYESQGSVYFRIANFPDYGKLSHKDLDGLQQGGSGRVLADEYTTEDVRDFALWKAYVPEDGDVFWETELGKGRPGWHIECSCMSMKYLGDTFDIHCGGVDLVFPHHENEVAQSEGRTGKPFANYWLHCEHLIVEGKKMSKSLGNFFSLRDLLEKGYSAKALRYVLLTTHYRKRLNFTFDELDGAAQALDRLQEFQRRLGHVQGTGSDLADEVQKCEAAFGEALDDDLNVAQAMAVLFDFVRDTNKCIDENSLGEAGASAATDLLNRLDQVLGLLDDEEEDAAPAEIMDLVMERQEARRSRDFARSDEIRDTLAAQGWIIKDTPDGPRVEKNA
jgi:cysteinyl-tRNA synthetase